MEKIASFPMYDGFLTYESADVLWEAIRSGSGCKDNLPCDLDKFTSCHATCTAGDALSLTQFCGYPLVSKYADHLQVVGVPYYAAPGCEGATYKSVLIVSESNKARTLEDLLSSEQILTVAANSFDSCSGWLMLLSALSDAFVRLTSCGTPVTRGNIRNIALTGSHIGSIKAVQHGYADIAAIDCVSFALAQRNCPKLLEGVRVLSWSPSAPALPFVTNKAAPQEAVEGLRKGLQSAVASTDPRVVRARQAHLLVGVDTCPEASACSAVYRRAIDALVARTNASPQTAALYATFYLGTMPSATVAVPAVAPVAGLSSGGQGGVLLPESYTVQPTAFLADETWPLADMRVVHSMKRQVMSYLFDVVHEACAERVTAASAATGAAQHPPFSHASAVDGILSPLLLIQALLPVVGKQLWPVLDSGGKGKLIFCSLTGTLKLLASLASRDREGDEEEDKEEEWLLLSQRHRWHTVARVAKEALVFIQLAAEKELAVSVSVTGGDLSDQFPAMEAQAQAAVAATAAAAVVKGEGPQEEEELWFANFMGAATNDTVEFAHDEATERKKLEQAEVTKRVWAADIMLSEELIRISRAGTNGVVAYLSAPKHNSRDDWANLVITEQEKDIDGWRFSAGHAGVAKTVAPATYAHIRLHRGLLRRGPLGGKVRITRSVFLGPTSSSSVATDTDNSSSSSGSSSNVKETQGCPHMPSLVASTHGEAKSGSGSGCPVAVGSNGKVLKRHVVYWKEVVPTTAGSDGAAVPASVPASVFQAGEGDCGNIITGNYLVPGGGKVTVAEFNKMLLQTYGVASKFVITI
jgi:hypothetical protein